MSVIVADIVESPILASHVREGLILLALFIVRVSVDMPGTLT